MATLSRGSGPEVSSPTVTPPKPQRGGVIGSAARRSEALAGALLAAPSLVVFTVFMFVPLVLTLWYSFHRYSGFGAMRWLGVQNYLDISQDPTFYRALVNTAVYTALSVPLGIVLALSAALLLNKVMPGRTLWRALIYVPVVVSGVAAGVIFLRLFDPIRGIVNQLLTTVGLPEVNWQGNGASAFLSVVIVTTWQGIGFGMVVYLAGLQGIPRELYEAGAVDGATGWKAFRRITWPLLGPTTFFLVVLSIIQSFQVFDVVYVLTRGGPGNATTFLVQYAYDEGFGQRRQGYAAALGVIIYIIVLILTVAQWRLSRRRDEA